MDNWMYLVPLLAFAMTAAFGFILGRTWSLAEILDLRSELEFLKAKHAKCIKRGPGGRFTR